MTWRKLWQWYCSWDFLIYAITYFAVTTLLGHAGYPLWASILAALVVDLTRKIAWEVFTLWRAQR